MAVWRCMRDTPVAQGTDSAAFNTALTHLTMLCNLTADRVRNPKGSDCRTFSADQWLKVNVSEPLQIRILQEQVKDWCYLVLVMSSYIRKHPELKASLLSQN